MWQAQFSKWQVLGAEPGHAASYIANLAVRGSVTLHTSTVSEHPAYCHHQQPLNRHLNEWVWPPPYFWKVWPTSRLSSSLVSCFLSLFCFCFSLPLSPFLFFIVLFLPSSSCFSLPLLLLHVSLWLLDHTWMHMVGRVQHVEGIHSA